MHDPSPLALAAATLFFVAAPRSQRPGRGSAEAAWKLLASKYDRNHDGRISFDEYRRSRSAFTRLDRNGDRVLTEADLEVRRRFRPDPKTLRAMGAAFLLRPLLAEQASLGRAALGRFFSEHDSDADGRIDWLEAIENGIPERSFRRAAPLLDTDGDGRISKAELLAGFEAADADGDGKLARAELGRGRRRGAAPAVGQRAPDFELPSLHDPKKLVRLSSFAGKKPVALIFGSYT